MRSHAGDQRQPARFVPGVEEVRQPHETVAVQTRPHLDSDRIADAAQERDMRFVRVARAIADPQHVRRTIVPFAGGAVDAGKRLFVAQQERLVRGVYLGLPDLRRVGGVEAARFHEGERLVDAVRKVAVAFGLGAPVDEAEVPAVHLMQVGVSALRQGAQEVERRGGLSVGAHHALGVGFARRRVEFDAVDDIAAIAGQLDSVPGFGGRRTRLRELAGDAPHLDHRQRRAEAEHHRHLQEHAEGVADVVGVEFGESLGAVSPLQQEGPAFGHLRQMRLERARLSGEHQRRRHAQAPLHRLHGFAVGIDGLLPYRQRTPPRRRPAFRHRFLLRENAPIPPARRRRQNTPRRRFSRDRPPPPR